MTTKAELRREIQNRVERIAELSEENTYWMGRFRAVEEQLQANQATPDELFPLDGFTITRLTTDLVATNDGWLRTLKVLADIALLTVPESPANLAARAELSYVAKMHPHTAHEGATP